ncbi:ParB N-terminal domain-containing protein [Nocardioides sp. SYSU DS0663]|uniref:ParB N-terminal domain-containing protein n=1 Tax=Nocardioides sp. SYSU DS0663 TaxID=3416445 RepID=UPI003F4B2E2C
MPQQAKIPVADLLLDETNARLGQESASQQQAAHALATLQGKRLVKLAATIVERGLDPAQPFSVLPTADRRRRYRVIEGNRRLLAVKALETPTIVQGALKPGEYKKLQALSLEFARDPVEEINCVVYAASEADAAYQWVLSRHAGSQEGAGLLEWGSDEKDRFASRHGDSQKRSLGGQIIDFLEAVDGSKPSSPISTNLTRVIGNPDVQQRLGVERSQGEILSWYPLEEVLKGLRRVVDDFESGRVDVKDVYHASDRKKYAEGIPTQSTPDPATRLVEPVKLTDLATGTPASKSATKKPKGKPKPPLERTTVASPTSPLNPQLPRLNKIYNELVELSSETFVNAGSVLLRVFLELAVDDYINRESVTVESKGDPNLAQRLKAVAADLEKKGKIPNALKRAVNKIADGQHTIAASVTNFHQYVHNPYVHPKPSELRTTWDELQPFLEAVFS